jgi:hypothetical protein
MEPFWSPPFSAPVSNEATGAAHIGSATPTNRPERGRTFPTRPYLALVADSWRDCSRQKSVALARQLRYALIPVDSARIFKNFGVRSCRAHGRQEHDALHTRLECGCR